MSDTLDNIADDIEDDKFASKEHEAYEKKYGRETVEEEMVAILEDLSGESVAMSEILSVSSNIFASMESIVKMDDEDIKVPLSILAQQVASTGFNTNEISIESDVRAGTFIPELNQTVADAESLTGSLLRWAGQAVVASYKVLTYTLKRVTIFITRTKKDADGIEKRLTRLDTLIKSRKSEDAKIYISKGILSLLVDEYELNESPAGAVSTFAGAIYEIIDNHIDVLKKLSSKADAHLNGSDGKINLDEYKKIVDDYIDDLEDKYKGKEQYIGNRYIKVNKDGKLSKLITVELGRPSPSTIVGKYRPMKGLSNSAIESQRSSLRGGVLKKMYSMADSTADDLEAIAKFSKLASSKKYVDKDKDTPELSGVAELSKYIGSTTNELLEGVMELSKIAYETIDAAVKLLEDSASIS